MNLNLPPNWLDTALPFAFPILWCVVLYVISVISGWRQLAKRYRCSTKVLGTTWRCQSAAMRSYTESGYGHCVNVTANEDGIGLAVLFLFRFGHPPMFIPWSEVLVTQVRRFIFFNRVRLTFPQESTVWIEFNTRLAGKIQKAIGHDWFPEPAE